MASTAASVSPASRASADQLPLWRMYVLRGTYALIAIAQLAMTGRSLLFHEPTVRGVIPSMIVGMCLVDLLGIKYPKQMLPMLLFEFTWKYIWFFAFGLPQGVPASSRRRSPAISPRFFLESCLCRWSFRGAMFGANM